MLLCATLVDMYAEISLIDAKKMSSPSYTFTIVVPPTVGAWPIAHTTQNNENKNVTKALPITLLFLKVQNPFTVT